MFDIDWFMEKSATFLNKCSKITFNNIETFDIPYDITLSKDATIESNQKTNFNFKNNVSIIIK